MMVLRWSERLDRAFVFFSGLFASAHSHANISKKLLIRPLSVRPVKRLRTDA